MKRTFDLILSLVLLLVFFPLIIILAIGVKTKLGSPIIFKQKRPGLHGEVFYFYKFRTMTNEVDDNGEPLPDEERLHSFGYILRKYSLDELPQLINVLKGDISLVGPRPLLMEYLPLYSEKHLKRHLVKPGITGWAQVNGRNALTWKDRLDLDVWYVENQSFSLDVKILFLTVYKVIRSDGVNQPGSVTMSRFKGLKSDTGGVQK